MTIWPNYADKKGKNGVRSASEQFYAGFSALLDLLFGPYRGLYFADVGFMKQEHAQAALSDASADGVGQLAVEEHAMESEVGLLGTSSQLELAGEGFGADADAH